MPSPPKTRQHKLRSQSKSNNPKVTPTGTAHSSARKIIQPVSELLNKDKETIELEMSQISALALEKLVANHSELITLLKTLSVKLLEMEEAQADNHRQIIEKIDAMTEDKVDAHCQILKKIDNIAEQNSISTQTISQLITTTSARDVLHGGCNDSPSFITQETIVSLIEEKQQQKIKEECRSLKSSISLEWNDMIQQRDKFFRNFIKNKKKSELYNNWLETSPDYIPFKFRPKMIPGEMEQFTVNRIEVARNKYFNDCKLLQDYAAIHKDKFAKVDEVMRNKFTEICSTEEQIKTISRQWRKEVQKSEDRASLQWSRNEAFLKRKKHEDIQNSETTLSAITWGEKLQNYGKKKRLQYNLNHPYSYSSFPFQHPGLIPPSSQHYPIPPTNPSRLGCWDPPNTDIARVT